MRITRSSARRLGAVVVTTALVSGVGTTVSPAQAATGNTYTQTGGDWLANQLASDHLVHGSYYDGTQDIDYVDAGLTLDVFYALNGVGARTSDQSAIVDALAAQVDSYTGSGTESYAGALGKLTTAVTAAGKDATAFGGQDLVDRLEDRVVTTAGSEQGRAVDGSAYGDYSNTIGQSFAVRALSGNDSGLADEATAFLLQQQCAAGFFRIQMGDTATVDYADAGHVTGPFTCDAAKGAPSIDATAFAVEALLAAQADGVTGLADDIADAGSWLAANQASDGSFSDMGTKNTNSTGLAGVALAATGHGAAAEKAGSWVAARQVSPADATTYPKLGGATGAIAYDDAAFAAGRTDGIPKEQRDQWVRASAQALPAVARVTAPTLSAPTGYVEDGKAVTVTLRGLHAAEPWKLAFGSTANRAGTGSGAGVATTSVTLPTGTRTYTVNAGGDWSRRTATTKVTALGAKKLSVSKRSARLKRSKVQRVTVTGLAAGERASLTYRGTKIWSGKASSRGVVTDSFRVGRSVGVKKVVARGQFSDRVGSTTFRVVR